MKLGLALGYWGAGPPPGTAEQVAAAEDLGFDSMWTAEACARLVRLLPILLAAEGPKNVALAAEIADGWQPLFYAPRHDTHYRSPSTPGSPPAAGARTGSRRSAWCRWSGVTRCSPRWS